MPVWITVFTSQVLKYLLSTHFKVLLLQCFILQKLYSWCPSFIVIYICFFHYTELTILCTPTPAYLGTTKGMNPAKGFQQNPQSVLPVACCTQFWGHCWIILKLKSYLLSSFQESGRCLVIFFIIYVIIAREKLWPLLLIYYYNGDTELLESGSNTQRPCWLLTPHIHPSFHFHWCWPSFRAPALEAFLRFSPQRISSSFPSPQINHHDVVWSSQLSFI